MEEGALQRLARPDLTPVAGLDDEVAGGVRPTE